MFSRPSPSRNGQGVYLATDDPVRFWALGREFYCATCAQDAEIYVDMVSSPNPQLLGSLRRLIPFCFLATEDP